jgi:hypothetical protein
MGQALGLLFVNNPDMGGAVFDSLPIDMPRDFASIGGSPFAVVNVGLLINQTGEQLEG